MIPFFAVLLLLAVSGCAVYFGCNRGMASKARGQQVRRFLIASVVGALPAGVGAHLLPLIVALAWMLTFPLLYHLTHRRSSPDYENYADTAAGIYLAGLLTALVLLVQGSVVGQALVGILAFLLLLLPVVQWVYYALYGTCIDANGMKIVQETHYNEIIEFARSYSLSAVLLTLLAVVGVLAGCVGAAVLCPVWCGLSLPAVSLWVDVALGCYVGAVGWYLLKPRHSLMARTGIVRLWLDIRDYSAGNERYLAEMERRLQSLQVEPVGQPYDRPHTMLLVIGESASRDYMSAFVEREHDTTPWMRQLVADEGHTVRFPNAYSCAMHTVQVLEKSLTEMNQYGPKKFYESCSIVDIAHRLGYRVHWYSNQGHLGAADTPITIVAETSDVAKWTKQELGRVQYDETLIDFLDELDATQNNLLVVHLKGSHFNFQNRYPQDQTVWGTPQTQTEVSSYENSLRYTDGVLHRLFDYCTERLNLQTMVYFSDHATVPDRRRSPNFDGFGDTRIPLLVWMSDEYQQKHASRAAALRQNRERYFTNDLIYDLFCGLLDIRSNRFDEASSLASPLYRYQREELLTYEGQRHIADDAS